MKKYPFTKTCKQCNAVFVINRASKRNKQFCCSDCFYDNKRFIIRETNCISCGKTLINEQLKFCSHACSAKYHNARRGPVSEIQKDKIRKSIISHYMNNTVEKQKIICECVICKVLFETTKTRMTCSPQCYATLARQNSRNNPKCGGQKHTHRIRVKNIQQTEFTLESSYELTLANDLNNHQVLWIRPSFFWYIDQDNRRRRYYPDFYLPEYNTYLDPKNDYLIQVDSEKVYRTSTQNNVQIFILNKDQLSWEKIQKMVDPR